MVRLTGSILLHSHAFDMRVETLVRQNVVNRCGLYVAIAHKGALLTFLSEPSI